MTQHLITIPVTFDIRLPDDQPCEKAEHIAMDAVDKLALPEDGDQPIEGSISYELNSRLICRNHPSATSTPRYLVIAADGCAGPGLPSYYQFDSEAEDPFDHAKDLLEDNPEETAVVLLTSKDLRQWADALDAGTLAKLEPGENEARQGGGG